MAKRLGNALYGRFAMRTDRKKFFIAYTQAQADQKMQSYHFKEVHAIKTLNNKAVFTLEGVKDIENEAPDPYSSRFRMMQVLNKVAPQCCYFFICSNGYSSTFI